MVTVERTASRNPTFRTFGSETLCSRDGLNYQQIDRHANRHEDGKTRVKILRCWGVTFILALFKFIWMTREWVMVSVVGEDGKRDNEHREEPHGFLFWGDPGNDLLVFLELLGFIRWDSWRDARGERRREKERRGWEVSSLVMKRRLKKKEEMR